MLFAATAAPAGLSLEDAVRKVQEHSYAVWSARHDSAAAALSSISAGRERYPVLSLTAQSFYIDEVQSIDLPFASREIGSNENYLTDIRVTMPLYTGGRLSSRIDILKQQSLAETMRLESERMASAYRARRAYLSVMNARALVDAARSSLERVQIVRRNVINLHDNGMADSLDLLEAELAVESAQLEVDRLETELNNARVSLTRLLGIDSRADIELSEVIPTPDTLRFPSLLANPIPDRPELRQLEYLVGAADRAAKAEMSGYLPIFSGFLGYSYGMPNRDWFEQTWNDYWTAGLVLTWEFNLGLKTARDVDAARERASSGRMARKTVYDNLLTQRDIAVNALRHAYKMFQTTETEYELSRRRYELATLQRDAGRISVNRLLELEAELAGTEQQYRASMFAYYLAESDLLYAVGSSRIFGGLQ